jgi:hypothetical protein
MEYEVVKDSTLMDAWRVEAIDVKQDGEVYVTIFSGPDAEERAREYADWKSGVRGMEHAKAS